MNFISLYAKEIVAFVVPLLVWFLNSRFQSRARLVQGTRHSFTFLINEPQRNPQGQIISPTQTVNTASISLYNTGRVTATKLEVVFNWKPQYFNIWPSRHYEERAAPDGRFSLLFENLAPKEPLGFELLAVNAPVPEIVTVRSEQVTAVKQILIPQPAHPRWKLALVAFLILAGLASVAYVIALIIQRALFI